MKINKSHDVYFREKLNDINNAIAFLESALPEPVKSLLNLSSLIITDDTFVSKEFQLLFSDIVYQCKTKSMEETYCSILIEHKSYKDTNVIFQVGAYVFGAYRTQLKKGEPLRLVIPIINYHGRTKWKFNPITDFFRKYEESLIKFIPQFDPIFCNIKSMSDETILGIRNVAIASLLITHKYTNDLEMLFSKLSLLYNALQNDKDRNSFHDYVVYVFITQPNSKKIIELIEKKENTSFNKVVMSAYDVIIKKGEQLGLVKGEMIGMDKAMIEFVLNSHLIGLQISTISKITKLTEDRIKEILHNNR